MRIEQLNAMSKERFTAALGTIFEHSPWVAERAWERRPFASREQLHEAMMDIVRRSPQSDILELFRAHPDLAGRIEMGEHSVREQQGAGLDRLSEAEYEQFISLNRAYTAQFGFPFILAVKGKEKAEILAAMRERIGHSPEREAGQALQEIGKITGFRLADLIPT